MKMLLIVGFLFFIPVFAHPQEKAAKQDSLPNGEINSRPQQRALEKEISSLNLTAEAIAALVSQCGERTTRMNGIIFYNYSYVQADIAYEFDKHGRATRERSKTYEIYPARGRRYVRVQIGEDGIPLSPEKIERERKRAADELIEAEKKSAQTQNTRAAASTEPSKRFWSTGILLTLRTSGGLGSLNLPIRPTDFLVSHDFSAARRTTFNGRETILLDFHPRPNFVFDKTNVSFQTGLDDFNRVMTRLGGRIWIDAADKVVVRLEAIPLQDLNSAETVKSDAPDPDAPLGFEFARLANGVWTPSRSWLNAYGRENIFGKVSVVSRAHRYSDFKLFKTEVKDVEIAAPKTQP